MDSHVITTSRIKYLCLPLDRGFVLTSGTVTDLIGACLDAGVSCVLLEEEHLPPDFFLLRSLEAGEVLQKLRTYDIRLAAVVSQEKQLPQRFREMLVEENRGQYFAIVARREQAVEWFLTWA